ncbi:MAG: uridine diphosphate-N-acetylglucosamine-binding protein YvcK [Fimbriimonas sp.]|nr:uridine diphosphate-N-acetylglucosamine-binding protein YvcK [Fimbriimonas sp.]
MIKSYRLRKLLAPTVGLQKAAGMMVLGIISLLLGIGLGFKPIVKPLANWFATMTHLGLERLVPRDRLDTTEWALGLVFLLFGIYLTFRAIRAVINHIVETLNPGLTAGKVDVYVRRRQLAQGPRIVAMGGGTGLSTLLRGLKHHSSNITAIVTVTDDGGSSGKLIQDKGMIPPGDIRNCLVALADAEKSMTDLFQHRFKDDSGSLSGHAIGNLLIAALVDQAKGDFERAIEIASDVLAIRGRVVPSTLETVGLRAVLEDGEEICGETAIVSAGRRIRRIHLDPPNCIGYKAAVEAIQEADLICIGPGSVYTSVIPNLLVPEIAEAIRLSKAPKVYICNVMTQPGESDTFSASEHVTTILNNTERKVFDYVMVNTGTPNESLLGRYSNVGQYVVEPDIDRIKVLGLKVLQGNYMSDTDFVRHDPIKVVSRLMSLVGR